MTQIENFPSLDVRLLPNMPANKDGERRILHVQLLRGYCAGECRVKEVKFEQKTIGTSITSLQVVSCTYI